eukprot:gene4578-4792_t
MRTPSGSNHHVTSPHSNDVKLEREALKGDLLRPAPTWKQDISKQEDQSDCLPMDADLDVQEKIIQEMLNESLKATGETPAGQHIASILSHKEIMETCQEAAQFLSLRNVQEFLNFKAPERYPPGSALTTLAAGPTAAPVPN